MIHKDMVYWYCEKKAKGDSSCPCTHKASVPPYREAGAAVPANLFLSKRPGTPSLAAIWAIRPHEGVRLTKSFVTKAICGLLTACPGSVPGNQHRMPGFRHSVYRLLFMTGAFFIPKRQVVKMA